MFFICATTLAWGGFQMAFGRVTEAISACVPVIGVICGVILLAIAFGPNHEIYHWTDAEHVQHDATLNFKKGFLNKGFFAVSDHSYHCIVVFPGLENEEAFPHAGQSTTEIKRGRKKIYLEQYCIGQPFILLFLH